jgi:hypothetical protein
MRYLYLIAGSAIALTGTYFIVNTFIEVTPWMDEIGVIVGLVFVYLGTINVLNYWYGMKARGLWLTAIAANAAMLAMCWVVGAHPEGLEWGLVAALVLAALLSLDPRSSRPA